MEEERGAHSIWSEHHRVVRRIDRRSLPQLAAEDRRRRRLVVRLQRTRIDDRSG